MTVHITGNHVLGNDEGVITPNAWANCNGGASTSGNPSLLKSSNISGLTDSGVGSYTLAFTSNMNTALYGWVTQTHHGGSQNDVGIMQEHDATTTVVGSCRLTNFHALNTATTFTVQDSELFTAVFFDT